MRKTTQYYLQRSESWLRAYGLKQWARYQDEKRLKVKEIVK